MYVLGAIDQGDIELVADNVLVKNLPSAEVEGLPDLTELWGENILDMDGPISLKNRKFDPKCWFCKAKPIFSDYATKLSFTFDRKFVMLSVFMFCIAGMIMNGGIVDQLKKINV